MAQGELVGARPLEFWSTLRKVIFKSKSPTFGPGRCGRGLEFKHLLRHTSAKLEGFWTTAPGTRSDSATRVQNGGISRRDAEAQRKRKRGPVALGIQTSAKIGCQRTNIEVPLWRTFDVLSALLVRVREVDCSGWRWNW